MVIKARVTQVFPVEEAKSGFKWQDFIVNYYESANQMRPDSIMLRLMGQDKIESTALKAGDEYRIVISHYVREFNGRNYNEVRLHEIAPWEEVKPEDVNPTPVAPETVETATAEPESVEVKAAETNPDEELPF